MADSWEYRFYRMQNGIAPFTAEQYLFSLPVNQAVMTTRLNQVGTFRGTVEQSHPSVQQAMNGTTWDQLVDNTSVYAILNGNVVWGGILDSSQYQRSLHTTLITAKTFDAYFANGRVISWNASYSAVDELKIAADLINKAQQVSGGNIGITLGQTPTGALAGTVTTASLFPSGGEVTLTQSWAVTDYKNVLQAVQDMAQGSAGFDFTFDCAISAGVPVKTFNLWYPRAGRSAQQQTANGSEVVFNLGGSSCIDFYWLTGSTQTANAMYAGGSGSGGTAISTLQQNANLLRTGSPLYENSVSFTDVSSQALLDALALEALRAVQTPVVSPKLLYRAGSQSDQPVGSYALGDDCRLVIDGDDYFGPNGYDSASAGGQFWRVIEQDIYVSDEGVIYQQLILDTPPYVQGT